MSDLDSQEFSDDVTPRNVRAYCSFCCHGDTDAPDAKNTVCYAQNEEYQNDPAFERSNEKSLAPAVCATVGGPKPGKVTASKPQPKPNKPTPNPKPAAPKPNSKPAPKPPKPIKPGPKPAPPPKPLQSVSNFVKMRDDLFKNKQHYKDPKFPCNDQSINHANAPSTKIIWKRPHEYATNCQFFVDGADRHDIQQGEEGDCWLLAAISVLATNKLLFHRVVPKNQGFTPKDKYAGIFHFWIYQYGRWQDVVVDDRLPANINGDLKFVHSPKKNEFWAPLLEKAFAKLYGSYKAICGGLTDESLTLLTGGICETYMTKEPPKNVHQILLDAQNRGALMCAGINSYTALTDEGLPQGHAYSITKVVSLDMSKYKGTGQVFLLRIRNPHGTAQEWNQAWSDQSSEWRSIPDEDRKKIGFTAASEGEFWMSYDDFKRRFNIFTICNVASSLKSAKKWKLDAFHGEWRRGSTSGGARGSPTFSKNPQYKITLVANKAEKDQKCDIVVGLMQKYRRFSRKKKGTSEDHNDNLQIAFDIFKMSGQEKGPMDLGNANPVGSKHDQLTEITGRFQLPPGQYCIVPWLFDSQEQGKFMLRVFSEASTNMQKLEYPIVLKSAHTLVSSPNVSSPIVSSPIVSCAPAEDTDCKNARELFKKAAGDDIEMTWDELKAVLDDTMGKEFSKDVYRCLIAMTDTDYSGTLNEEEFTQLWKNIRRLNGVFQRFASGSSGYLTSYQLRDALHSAGYSISNDILNLLCKRYANKQGDVSFDDFLMCAVRLKTIIEKFKEKEIENRGVAGFTKEEWIKNTLYT